MSHRKSEKKKIVEVFTLGETPIAAWSQDINLDNSVFLKGLKPEYYEYLAEKFIEDIRAENNFHAATALRSLYFQCLENMFSLIFAYVQSPTAQLPYILKYREEIDILIEKVDKYQPIYTKFNVGLVRNYGWRGIAELVFINVREDIKDRFVEKYGLLWQRLSGDYINSINRAEYNSIKHGMRVFQGGFRMAIGLQEEFGVPASAEKMISLGGSKFGNVFYRLNKLDKTNYSIEQVSVNWNPENLYWAVMAMAASMKNIVNASKRINGIEGGEEIYYPEDEDAFSKPWSEHVGAISSSGGSLRVEKRLLAKPEDVMRCYENTFPPSEEPSTEEKEPDAASPSPGLTADG